MTRYVLSETKETLYVAFMGTKQRRDLIANASVIQDAVWPQVKGGSHDMIPKVCALLSNI